MEAFGGKPGHVDGCTGWCFLSSCIVVAQPIFSDAQVCPLHQVMDVLCKHHNVGRKVDGNPNPLVRGKKSKVGPSTRLRNRRHLGTTRENSRKVWIIGMDRHGFFLWMRFRFLGKWRPAGLRRWPENPIEQQVYIYIYLWVFNLVASIEEQIKLYTVLAVSRQLPLSKNLFILVSFCFLHDF